MMFPLAPISVAAVAGAGCRPEGQGPENAAHRSLPLAHRAMLLRLRRAHVSRENRWDRIAPPHPSPLSCLSTTSSSSEPDSPASAPPSPPPRTARPSGSSRKVHPVRSHSNAAQGGINAALNPEDSWESHAFDTVKGSDYLGDQDAIEIMCREAPDEMLHLEHLGVTFHRNEEGKLGTRAFGGASAARTYYVADITGQAILHVLYEQLMKHDEVDRYEEWFTTALVQRRRRPRSPAP